MKTESDHGRTLSPAFILTAAALMFATMMLLAYVWATASPQLGRLYAGIRLAETATLWRFTEWGRYFTTMPQGEPFSFVSIYKSSIPFGITASLATALIGFVAWRKRTTKHIDVVLAEPKGGFSVASIMRDMAPVMPHVALAAAPRPPGGTAPPAFRPGPNPFASLRDLRDGQSVWLALSALSWQEVATFALILDEIAPVADRTRIEALDKAVGKAAMPDKTGAPVQPDSDKVAAMAMALTQAMSDLRQRDLEALEQAHEAAASDGTSHDAIAALTDLATRKRCHRLPKFAWLSRADPRLHHVVVQY